MFIIFQKIFNFFVKTIDKTEKRVYNMVESQRKSNFDEAAHNEKKKSDAFGRQ